MEEGHKKLSGPVNKGILIFGNSAKDPLPLYSILCYKGTMQAIVGAMFLDEDPDQAYLFTKVVYPKVGKTFGVSGSAVERNLRSLIIALWQKRRLDLFRFLNGVTEKAPKTAEFLSYLMLRLRLAEEKEIETALAAGLPMIPGADVETEELRKIREEHDKRMAAALEEARRAMSDGQMKLSEEQINLFSEDKRHLPDGVSL